MTLFLGYDIDKLLSLRISIVKHVEQIKNITVKHLYTSNSTFYKMLGNGRASLKSMTSAMDRLKMASMRKRKSDRRDDRDGESPDTPTPPPL